MKSMGYLYYRYHDNISGGRYHDSIIGPDRYDTIFGAYIIHDKKNPTHEWAGFWGVCCLIQNETTKKDSLFAWYEVRFANEKLSFSLSQFLINIIFTFSKSTYC